MTGFSGHDDRQIKRIKMSETDFQHYYREIRERDQKAEEEAPLPHISETSVWTVFGLSVGTASIIIGIFTSYAVILAGFSLFMSVIGFIRNRTDTLGIASVICSAAGVLLGIAMEAVRIMFFGDGNLTFLNEFLHM
jgi:hypothetical protein